MFGELACFAVHFMYSFFHQFLLIAVAVLLCLSRASLAVEIEVEFYL